MILFLVYLSIWIGAKKFSIGTVSYKVPMLNNVNIMFVLLFLHHPINGKRANS